mgnify:CR=1 FL=1
MARYVDLPSPGFGAVLDWVLVLRNEIGVVEPAGCFSSLRERRNLVEHAQDFVAIQVRHLEQHALDSGIAIRRERRWICRRIEYRD